MPWMYKKKGKDGEFSRAGKMWRDRSGKSLFAHLVSEIVQLIRRQQFSTLSSCVYTFSGVSLITIFNPKMYTENPHIFQDGLSAVSSGDLRLHRTINFKLWKVHGDPSEVYFIAFSLNAPKGRKERYLARLEERLLPCQGKNRLPP